MATMKKQGDRLMISLAFMFRCLINDISGLLSSSQTVEGHEARMKMN